MSPSSTLHPIEMENTDVILQLDGGIEVRRWRDDDTESIAHHGTNPRVWDNLSDRIPHPYTVNDARAWIAITRKAETQVVSGSSLEENTIVRVPSSYVIVVRGDPCGTVGLDFGTGVYRLNASLGYWLGEAYHSQGIMSRVVPAFVQWTWQTFGWLVRLNATAYASNVGSQKILKKSGFVHESTRINGCIKNGKLRDEVTLGALRPGSK